MLRPRLVRRMNSRRVDLDMVFVVDWMVRRRTPRRKTKFLVKGQVISCTGDEGICGWGVQGGAEAVWAEAEGWRAPDARG